MIKITNNEIKYIFGGNWLTNKLHNLQEIKEQCRSDIAECMLDDRYTLKYCKKSRSCTLIDIYKILFL